MNESRLQRMLEEFQDDALSDSDCRELLQWFDEDESRLSPFVDELRVGNALAALSVLDSDRLPLAVNDCLKRSERAIDLSSDVRQRLESRVRPSSADGLQSGPAARRWSRGRTRWWIAACAVAAVVSLCVFLTGDVGTGSGDVVATVQNARKVQAVSAGDPLRSGQVLKLVDGRVTISFQSGARLAIQAPAELKLLGPNSAQLQHGVATVRVPGAIKGFILETPHQRMTDLGTSFGVDVDTKGDTAISVFEGEIELEDRRRLVGGQSVALSASEQSPREIPYAISQFLNTWRVSFGVEQLIGDVRVASPGERHSPGLVRDSDSLLLFPEREDAFLEQGCLVDAMEPGTYSRPFRKHTVKLTQDVRVDSFLLQYNPGHDDSESKNQTFQGELHFDRPIVALIMQKDLLDASDARMALPETDFRNIFRRGINNADVVTLSPDRRVLRVALNVSNGVDQIRVLVAADNAFNDQ